MNFCEKKILISAFQSTRANLCVASIRKICLGSRRDFTKKCSKRLWKNFSRANGPTNFSIDYCDATRHRVSKRLGQDDIAAVPRDDGRWGPWLASDRSASSKVYKSFLCSLQNSMSHSRDNPTLIHRLTSFFQPRALRAFIILGHMRLPPRIPFLDDPNRFDPIRRCKRRLYISDFFVMSKVLRTDTVLKPRDDFMLNCVRIVYDKK